jgi:hypothetical protein
VQLKKFGLPGMDWFAWYGFDAGKNAVKASVTPALT